MCSHDTHDGACDTCTSTDEWIVPESLRQPQYVLSRDGGEPQRQRRGRPRTGRRPEDKQPNHEDPHL